MRLWVCIPVHNRFAYTQRCLETLRYQDYPDYHVVVCDDGSTDGTAECIAQQYPEVTVLHGNDSLWWTGAINRCVEHVLISGDIQNDAVVTLNNDLEVEAGYLSALADAATRYPDALITSAGHDIKTGKLIEPGLRQNWLTAKARHLDPARDRLREAPELAEVTHAPGRGTLVPLFVFAKLGLYDFKHLPHYGADYDFTYRSRRAGYRLLISYRAKVLSHVEATGMAVIRRSFGASDLKRYLTNIKSPANISVRWWLAINNCPRYLLPSYLLLDTGFVIASYFKYHLLRFIRSAWRV